MEDILFITQNLYNKLMGLATYLEEHSLYLLNLVQEMTFEDTDDQSKYDLYSKTLSSIYSRAKKIKEELVSTTLHQNDIVKCDVAFKSIFKNLGDNLIHLSNICEEISDPNYYLDTNGILREIN
ncbi:MAG: hypothetical protein NTX65_13370 [Ignavibacteriales bacterium]|nr:hypothetical protein [Ignavibacteriales bacterium]